MTTTEEAKQPMVTHVDYSKIKEEVLVNGPKDLIRHLKDKPEFAEKAIALVVMKHDVTTVTGRAKITNVWWFKDAVPVNQPWTMELIKENPVALVTCNLDEADQNRTYMIANALAGKPQENDPSDDNWLDILVSNSNRWKSVMCVGSGCCPPTGFLVNKEEEEEEEKPTSFIAELDKVQEEINAQKDQQEEAQKDS